DVRVLRDRPQDIRRRAGLQGASAVAEGGRGVRCFAPSDPFHARRGPGESRPLSAAASAEAGGRRAEESERALDETRGGDRSFSAESARPEGRPEDRAIDRIERETGERAPRRKGRGRQGRRRAADGRSVSGQALRRCERQRPYQSLRAQGGSRRRHVGAVAERRSQQRSSGGSRQRRARRADRRRERERDEKSALGRREPRAAGLKPERRQSGRVAAQGKIPPRIESSGRAGGDCGGADRFHRARSELRHPERRRAQRRSLRQVAAAAPRRIGRYRPRSQFDRLPHQGFGGRFLERSGRQGSRRAARGHRAGEGQRPARCAALPRRSSRRRRRCGEAKGRGGAERTRAGPAQEPSETVSTLAGRLIRWQARHGRHDLPWQQTRDPYRIWLSEVMLQQTQVATVIPYYERFLARFPDVKSLAGAHLDDVLALWSGLGYYSRARNLRAAARILVESWGGRFPRTREALASLPGVGRSTAAAIAVFAFGEREAILDGNVKRVLARHFAVRGFPGERRVVNRLWKLAESQVPEKDVERYTQALMDLGAGVCTRTRPACASCPLRASCEARSEGKAEAYPRPRPRNPVPLRKTAMLLLLRGGEVLLEKRPPAGLWG